MKRTEFKDKVQLISDGLPQFLDFEYSLEEEQARKLFYFYQERLEESGKFRLHALKEYREEGTFIDQVTGLEYNSDPEFRVKLDQITPWLDKWLPLPFFLESGEFWDSGENKYAPGPMDWARARITKSPDNDRTYFVTLAFDMTTQPLINGRFIGLPEHTNVGPQTYSLAYQYRDNGWFLNEQWVDGWLKDYWEDYFGTEQNKREKRKFTAKFTDHDEDFSLSYLAYYLVFLYFVNEALGSRKVVVDNPNRDGTPPVEVDLVLDIGNSRSIGSVFSLVV